MAKQEDNKLLIQFFLDNYDYFENKNIKGKKQIAKEVEFIINNSFHTLADIENDSGEINGFLIAHVFRNLDIDIDEIVQQICIIFGEI